MECDVIRLLGVRHERLESARSTVGPDGVVVQVYTRVSALRRPARAQLGQATAVAAG